MTKQTDGEYINIQMVHNMKDNGRMINRMEKAMKYGQMALSMKERIVKGRNMVLENINGMMAQRMKVIGQKIKLVDLEFTFGQMEDVMKENG